MVEGSGQSNGVQVDVALLQIIQADLRTLTKDTIPHLRTYLEDVHRPLAGTPKRSALGGVEIPEVQDLTQRLQGTFTAINNTLKGMADQLDRAGDGLQQIADNHQSTEDRNAASTAGL